MRTRAVLIALVTAVVTLAPIGSAHAATPLTASITCDSATDTISTRISGGTLAPNFSYKMVFKVLEGSYFSTSGTQSSIPNVGSGVTVPVTSAADGTVSVAGYTRSWPAENYLFYTETVRVSVQSASDGVEVASRDGKCTYDLRTTVNLTCDSAAHTITGTVTGVNYRSNQSLRLQYWQVGSSQATADSPRFTGPFSSGPTFTHSATASASGSWSDPAQASTITSDPYYLDERLTVVVRDLNTNLPVGGGSAYCLYVDQGHPNG